MDTAEGPRGGLTTYLVVYVIILAIAALQIVIAYQKIDGSQMLLRMLSLAIVQSGLAVTFFMHMKSEKRTLALFLLPATVFVLAMMNMFWSDSFRLLNDRLLQR
ncbi:MAG TPA: cytochrome C oxidase subunit IV family protein [Terriglobales bacterium]|nr:cytochrome C oxidase subunit IV family protein [Terriglobales bacterium]